MKLTDDFLQSYISQLSRELDQLSKKKQQNFLEEISDHINDTIKEEETKGKNEEEILLILKDEFPSPRDLAFQLMNETAKESVFKNPTLIIALTIAGISLPFFFKPLGNIPLAMIVFIYSYVILTRKNPILFLLSKGENKKSYSTDKYMNKLSYIGSAYLFLVGILMLLDNVLELPYIFPLAIVIYILLRFYIQKKVLV